MSKQDTPIVKWKLFIPWLQSQPEDRSFEFIDNRRCMICAFLQETHGIKANVSTRVWSLKGDTRYRNPKPIPRDISTAMLKVAAAATTASLQSLITIKAVKDRLLK